MLKLENIRQIQDLRDEGLTPRDVSELLRYDIKTIKKYWDSSLDEVRKHSRYDFSALEPYREDIMYYLATHTKNCTRLHAWLVEEKGLDVRVRQVTYYVNELVKQLRKDPHWATRCRQAVELSSCRL